MSPAPGRPGGGRRLPQVRQPSAAGVSVRPLRFFHRKPHAPAAQPAAAAASDPLDPSHLSRVFRPPTWLRDLGLMSWFLVGMLALLVGVTWVLGITSTIVEPVVVGTVVAIVAAPLVAWLQRHRVKRGLGAAIVILSLIAIVVVVVALVIGGILDQSGEIRSTVGHGGDKIEGWFHDADANSTSGPRQDVNQAVSNGGATLLHGLAEGIRGLTSLIFFLTFTVFSVFFLLTGGPGIRRWVDRHMGLPVELATLITSNVMVATRRYFLGVTMVAAFNAAVVGIGALILDVPLAGTIAVVTFVTAYIPYIGAFISGAFAVLLALGGNGTDTALIMLVIVILANGLLQNLFQPLAYGAALDLNPLAVLIVTIGAGALFGMIGMIVAAPLLSAGTHVAREIARAREAAEPPATAGAPLQSGP
jgi:putative heme transporter